MIKAGSMLRSLRPEVVMQALNMCHYIFSTLSDFKTPFASLLQNDSTIIMSLEAWLLRHLYLATECMTMLDVIFRTTDTSHSRLGVCTECVKALFGIDWQCKEIAKIWKQSIPKAISNHDFIRLYSFEIYQYYEHLQNMLYTWWT